MHGFESLFLVAFFLYTLVIMTHQAKGILRGWMVALFFLGFAADGIGTYVVCGVTPPSTWDLHAITGFGALGIMGVHFFWAAASLAICPGWERHFTRYSIYAWGLWMIAFVSGAIIGIAHT